MWPVEFQVRTLAQPYRLAFTFEPPTVDPSEVMIAGYLLRFYNESEELIGQIEVPSYEVIYHDGQATIDIYFPEFLTSGNTYLVDIVPFTFYRALKDASEKFAFFVPSSFSSLRFWMAPDHAGQVEYHYAFDPIYAKFVETYSWEPIQLPIDSEQPYNDGIGLFSNTVFEYGVSLIKDDANVWLSHTFPEIKLLGIISDKTLISGSGERQGSLRVFYFKPITYINRVETPKTITLSNGYITFSNVPSEFCVWGHLKGGKVKVLFNSSEVGNYSESFLICSWDFQDSISSVTLQADTEAELYSVGFIYSHGRLGALKFEAGRDIFLYELIHGAYSISDYVLYWSTSGPDIEYYDSNPINLTYSNVSAGDNFVANIYSSTEYRSAVLRFEGTVGAYSFSQLGPSLLFESTTPQIRIPPFTLDFFSTFIKNHPPSDVVLNILSLLGKYFSSGTGVFPYGDYVYLAVLSTVGFADVFFESSDPAFSAQGYVFPTGLGILWLRADEVGLIEIVPKNPIGVSISWVRKVLVNSEPKVLASLYFAYADQIGSLIQQVDSMNDMIALPEGDVEPATFWKNLFNFEKKPDASWEWWNTFARIMTKCAAHFGQTSAFVDCLGELPWIEDVYFRGISGYSDSAFYSTTIPLVVPSDSSQLQPGLYKVCLSAFVRTDPSVRGAETLPVCAAIRVHEPGFLLLDFEHAIVGDSHPSGETLPSGYRVYVWKNTNYLGLVAAIGDHTIPYFDRQTTILVANGYFDNTFYPPQVDLSQFEYSPKIRNLFNLGYIRSDVMLEKYQSKYELKIIVDGSYDFNHYDIMALSKLIYSVFPVFSFIKTEVIWGDRHFEFSSILDKVQSLYVYENGTL